MAEKKPTYEERLKIPVEGNDEIRFETESGLHIATGYLRVVIGGRGPYVEFDPEQIVRENIHIPEGEKYRTTSGYKDRVYYYEWRTTDDSNVKVYDQKRTVAYADYKIGFYYISPFDLIVESAPVITPLKSKR